MSLFERLAREKLDWAQQIERDRQNRQVEEAKVQNARRQKAELHRAAQNQLESTPLPSVLSQLGEVTGGKISSHNDYSSTGYRSTIDFGERFVPGSTGSRGYERKYINVTSNPNGSIEIHASGGKTIRTSAGELREDPVKVEQLIEKAYDSMKPVQYLKEPPKISLS